MSPPSLGNQESGTPPTLVDTHCHLDDKAYQGVFQRVLDNSRARGVTRWIVVGFAPDRWESTLDVARDVPGMSYMLGLHPGRADEWSPSVSDRLQSLLASTRAVAIGEIGLDFFRGETNSSAQMVAFNDQLDQAVDRNLPAVIHMRSAENELLRLLRSRQALPPLVFHSFDGTMGLRDFIIDNGSVVGIGGLATRTSATDLREVIRTIPLDQMVLETDSPYLIPKGARGRQNVPGNVAVIAKFLAGFLNRPLDEVAETTTRNAERTFRLDVGNLI